MDIYKQKSKWKIWLAILGVVIILASFFYTNSLAKSLEMEEAQKAEALKEAFKSLGFSSGVVDYQSFQDLDCDMTLAQSITSSNTSIPIILENDAGIIFNSSNFDEAISNDTILLRQEINKIKSSGVAPQVINFGAGEIVNLWYKNSVNLERLRFFPYIQFGLITAFIGLGYFGFSTARRSEQNQVWAGMAKETAHQLGTPISAIIGWIEHLKAMHESDADSMEVLGEFRKDVTRLELIADRFSKIGSAPELEKRNLYEVLENVFDYMKRRSPRKVSFDIPTSETPVFVNINEHLFEWVIENLLRNAIDALGGEGNISGVVETNNNDITILISDTGKGIPQSKFKTVFEPGFTTKKRGWGLGLSLAKRIIESYHLGRIFVKSSSIDEGTTFAVKLPKA